MDLSCNNKVSKNQKNLVLHRSHSKLVVEYEALHMVQALNSVPVKATIFSSFFIVTDTKFIFLIQLTLLIVTS